MKFVCSGILLSLLSKPVSVAANIRGQGQEKKSRHLTIGNTECRLWKNCLQFLPDEENEGAVEVSTHEWVCTFSDPNILDTFTDYGDRKIIGAGIDEYLLAQGAESGNSVLVLSHANIYEEVVEINLANVIEVRAYDANEADDASEIDVRRQLTPSIGTLNTLVVRVNAIDSSPNSAADLSSDIFNDAVCLKSQFGKCSHGAMDVQEYIPGNGVSNVPTAAPGVVDVFVNRATSNTDYSSMQSSANIALRNMLGVSDPGSLFDLVMFCMPPGMGNWLAYAYIGRWDSYYNGEWCQKVSSQMHEVGHNIRLHHSGEYTGSSNNQEYGDLSGYMGYSFFSDDTPQMCFNAVNYWQLGWVADKQIEVDPTTDLCTTPTSFLLNGFVDYQNTSPGANIVIKVGDFFYLGFNKGTDFNIGTFEVKNQVTVHNKLGCPSCAVFSKLQEGLDVGNIANMVISSSLTVTVKYVSNANFKDAVIELSVSGSGASTNCPTTTSPTNSPIAPPTNEPTPVPTGSPTGSPTADPTGQPTTAPPTEFPTPVPTTTPTDTPTESPTNEPTPSPTGSPTISPTASPTGQPTTGSPTVSPTASPTGQPTTGSPTVSPTSDPTGQPTTAPPTESPTPVPTASPTNVPTASPTNEPTSVPTGSPTVSPTEAPTDEPTTASPTNSPSSVPSNAATDAPTPVPTVPPTFPPTNNPTARPVGWQCIKANFRGGVGTCPGMKAGYYPDLTNRHSYCFCTGSNAPSRYEKCNHGLRWDGFPNNWGKYLSGNKNGINYGRNGYWGTRGGTCTWSSAVSRKTKQRPPYRN